jgi:hypothetical protein
MAKPMKEQVEKRVKDGWIRTVMAIEVMAISKEAAKDALEKHVRKMEMEDGTLVSFKEFKDIREVDKPFPNVPKAYSYVVEMEVFAVNFDRLVSLVINYAPSSVEIISPEEISIDMGEGQGIVNTVSEMIHKFAATGLGGIMIEGKEED